MRFALIAALIGLTCSRAVGQTGVFLDSYVSAGYGDSQTLSSDIRISQPSVGTNAVFHGVSWRTEPANNAPYYSLRLGTFFRRSPHWGAELSFTHNKAIANTNRAALVTGAWKGEPVHETAPIDSRVQEVRVTHGENLISLSVLYRTLGSRTPSFPRGRLQAYFGAGPILFYAFDINRVDGIGNKGGFHWSSFGWQVFGGVRYGLTPGLSLFLEPKYTDCEAHLHTFDGGRITTPLRTFHIGFGLVHRI